MFLPKQKFFSSLIFFSDRVLSTRKQLLCQSIAVGEQGRTILSDINDFH